MDTQADKVSKDRAELTFRMVQEAKFSNRHMAFNGPFKDEEWNEKAATVEDKLGSGALLALVGSRGTGKTQMAHRAVVLHSEWIIKSTSDDDVICFPVKVMSLYSATYTRAMNIFIALRGSYNKDSGTSEEQIIRDHCRPKLLIIDEMHERGESTWEDRILTHIIDTRYGDMKDTILISNQTVGEFAQQVGPSIISRLTETGGIIVCDWDSFRRSPTPAA